MFPYPRAGPSFSWAREGHGEGDHGVHSPVDSIVAAEYALYVLEKLQVAVFAPPESNLPAAIEARLAKHVTELADEHAVFEEVLESLFARDEQERDRVSLPCLLYTSPSPRDS